MKTKMFKIAANVLMLAGCLSCDWQTNPDCGKEVSPCDIFYYAHGIPPWMDKVIFEWLENGFYGKIGRCDYRDGYGFLFEQFENNLDDIVYSFRACDGTILFEGEKRSIEDTYPELEIKNQMLLLRTSPSWCCGDDNSSDEFLCNVINPFTLPRVQEFTYRCSERKCTKLLYICHYKDGVGFLLREHVRSRIEYEEFLDCSGNLLCTAEIGSQLCPELEIKRNSINRKLILELYISLNIKYLNQ